MKPLGLVGVVIILIPLRLMLLMLSIVTGRKPRRMVGLVDLEEQLCLSTLTRAIAIADSFLPSEIGRSWGSTLLGFSEFCSM